VKLARSPLIPKTNLLRARVYYKVKSANFQDGFLVTKREIFLKTKADPYKNKGRLFEVRSAKFRRIEGLVRIPASRKSSRNGHFLGSSEVLTPLA